MTMAWYHLPAERDVLRLRLFRPNVVVRLCEHPRAAGRKESKPATGSNASVTASPKSCGHHRPGRLDHQQWQRTLPVPVQNSAQNPWQPLHATGGRLAADAQLHLHRPPRQRRPGRATRRHHRTTLDTTPASQLKGYSGGVPDDALRDAEGASNGRLPRDNGEEREPGRLARSLGTGLTALGHVDGVAFRDTPSLSPERARGPGMEPLQAGDPRRVGRYTVEARLGSGGMGRVFLGRSDGGDLAALKIIHEGFADDETFRCRFRHEFESARRVSGVNTAAVLDGDPAAERPWIATEFVDGPSLHDIVSQHGPCNTQALRTLARDVAAALKDIHAEEIVHRDLKPSNVMLSGNRAKVIDFGIAKSADASGLTSTGFIAGSAAYMSPEQTKYETVGPASDVFAFGSLLYYAATGVALFGTGPPPAVMLRVVQDRVDLTAVSDETLRSLMARCLDKDPTARPTSAAIINALDAKNDVTEIRPQPQKPEDREQEPEKPFAWRRATWVAAACGALVLASWGTWATASGNRGGDTTADVRPSDPPTSPSAEPEADPPSDASRVDKPVSIASSGISDRSTAGASAIDAVPPLDPPAPAIPADRTNEQPSPTDRQSVPVVARGVPSPSPTRPRGIDTGAKAAKTPPIVQRTSDGATCYATAVDGVLTLPADQAHVAGGPNFTSAGCSGIHLKLYSAKNVTFARACLETSPGTVGRCGQWVRLSYPDTWDTLLMSVPSGSRWQLQMFGDRAQTVQFRYTA